MWKPDVQGRGKIQKAFRNGESNNSASELELVLSTMGPGDRQGAVGLCVGVRNKARLHFRHQMGLCSNTGGGVGGERGWAGAHGRAPLSLQSAMSQHRHFACAHKPHPRNESGHSQHGSSFGQRPASSWPDLSHHVVDVPVQL